MYTKQQLSELSDIFLIEDVRIKDLCRVAKKYKNTKAKATDKNTQRIVQKLIGEAVSTNEAFLLGIIYYQMLTE